jgi:hypothetical protein
LSVKNFRVEVLELAASLGAVGLPPIVREFCERDGVERARRKVNAHRHLGFPLREDVLRDLRRSLLRALADVPAVFILVTDVGDAVAEVHALGA